jgi:aspartate racemase
MGPEATVHLFQKIIENTEASSDQDHLRVFIDSNPKIPDRTPAILGFSETPLPMMVETAKNLESVGADFIVIPPVSAHYFIEELGKEVAIPIISIIDEVAAEIKSRLPEIERIGLIATTGTVQSELFQNRLDDLGVKVLVPSREEQEKLIMSAIYGESGIKAGFRSRENKQRILKASRALIDRGVVGIIAVRTELTLVIQKSDIKVPFFDCLNILSPAAIRPAKPNHGSPNSN